MNQQEKLFDIPELAYEKKPKSEVQRRKNRINYRLSETKDTCKKCTNSTYTQIIHGENNFQWTKYFLCRKCPYIGFTRGSATDIKKGYICDLFEKQGEL